MAVNPRPGKEIADEARKALERIDAQAPNPLEVVDSALAAERYAWRLLGLAAVAVVQLEGKAHRQELSGAELVQLVRVGADHGLRLLKALDRDDSPFARADTGVLRSVVDNAQRELARRRKASSDDDAPK